MIQRPVERALEITFVDLLEELGLMGRKISDDYGLRESYDIFGHVEVALAADRQLYKHSLAHQIWTFFAPIRAAIANFFQRMWYRILFGSLSRQKSQYTEVITKALEYRRGSGYDTWHFCLNCSNWPTSNYHSLHKKPTTSELCNECQAKLIAGICG